MLEKLKLAEIKQFLNEVKLEMRKISWPGRKEVYGTTIVVLGAVFFFAIFLGLVDAILHFGVDQIFKLFR